MKSVFYYMKKYLSAYLLCLTAMMLSTIRENLCYGRNSSLTGESPVTEEEMIAAAKALNAHEFIMEMEKG